MSAVNDEEAFAFYADESNQQAGRRAAKRPSRKLTGHIPVRFPEELVAQVRAFADADGVTVSTWIRNLASREVERRSPARSIAEPVKWTQLADVSPSMSSPSHRGEELARH